MYFNFNFLARLNNSLFFFSEIIIIFLAFFLNIFKDKALDIVSIVLPDFEIIMKRTSYNFSFFFNVIIFFSLILFKK